MRSVEDILAESERWTVRDVASFFKVSTSWVYKQVDLGLLPAHRYSGSLRFEPAAVRAFAKTIAVASKPRS